MREFTSPKLRYKRSFLNPAQLFIISFFLMIFIGALLLMLPKATHHGISFIDALFTSTSAVCVTGLIVVDTSSYFTQFGQTLILLLIQAGGLGILTFASYFSYFFKGGSTYENQLALSDMTNTEKLGEVFTTVKRILAITFFVELIGAFFIYMSIDKMIIPSFYDRLYFSVFHSISAFCNAGFSTLPNGMMEQGFVFNYPLQLSVILIFVFGGLGFPIVINSIRYIKHLVVRYVLWFLNKENNYRPWILTLSNKINLVTTSLLIVFGFLLIYLKEYNNVLTGHSGFGKIVTALFTATTPRTAGFNSIDFSQLHFSSIIIIILLMWIGASPASTGGGIKTSTFAISTLNYLSLAKGKNKIEVFRREIADISIRRAFAVMTLSLVVIGTGIFLIAHFDSHIPLLDIAFENFSAYSTVGLSLGITGDLSSESKLVLVAVMFIGRVTTLTILIAFFRKVKQVSYSYPSDEILIN
ncbi:MAG: ATPase [Flavobacteriia bacterium]|nr:ATPase [Flavobacteriia bacterium]OJX36398.1 MAG: ATPase [Flavobacteriia bacterium 40-80]